ncbi:hypothetical protein BDV95DRAFT_570683 [Massariosphaeria phaeospora]|uniref:GRF-like zinc ribbon domain-containing protein n=1 Tax=Massariosphaeria phaeospora TaxID=100035 RepID=A0A7C8I891_9PLEO|nr:hypothetical protein BDV95DRAFT_578685 [Massariosphaeria phaeospora]KAF2871806.1 hypothetical protein BDV95DRAFT_570683 [Massariosphaeria phaeospora]
MSFDLSSLERINLTPPPEVPPKCFLCSGPSAKFITRCSNRKGNAGRHYNKCVPCGKFLGFADDRGNDPNNPPCNCGTSSKRQVAGPETQVPRGVHYVCRLGACDFYAPARDADLRQITVNSDLVGLLAQLSII